MKGKLIAFEGVDGSGKTTHIKLLEKYLQEEGFTVHIVSHPTNLFKGIQKLIGVRSVRSQCPEIELMSYMIDMAFSVQTKIIPLLQDECIVLCDRYIDSTIVYQGYVGTISPKTVRTLIDFAVRYHYPDLAIWLDVSPEIALKRTKERDVVLADNENLDFYEKVCIGYYNIWSTNPERIRRVDASRQDDAESAIRTAVLNLLEE